MQLISLASRFAPLKEKLFFPLRLGKVLLQHGPREALLRYRVYRYEARCEKSPGSIPMLSYDQWVQQRAEAGSSPHQLHLLMILHEISNDYLTRVLRSILLQSYSTWRLTLIDQRLLPGIFDPGTEKLIRQHNRIRWVKKPASCSFQDILTEVTKDSSDIFLFLDERALLHPGAFFAFAQVSTLHQSDFIYSDEITFFENPKDARFPFYKPELSPDTLRSCNYVGSFFGFSRELYNSLVLSPDDPCTSLYDLILRLAEKARHPYRVPELLCWLQSHDPAAFGPFPPKESALNSELEALASHLRRVDLRGRAVPGALPFLHRLSYEIQGTPLVSILIPTRDHLEDLSLCIRSIREKTTFPNWEILLLENGSQAPETQAFYQDLLQDPRIRIHVWTKEFNFAAICNEGAKQARGDYLLLLNNDTEVISSDWIEQMLMYAQRKDVGAVGAKLYYPDETIQHAGIIIDPVFTSFHYLRNTPRKDSGYAFRLQTVQNLSAVTGACLMVKRSCWDQVGGLEEAYSVTYNDTDFCMKLRKAGFINVWTPYAELYHHELKSRGQDRSPDKVARAEKEKKLFCTRWQQEIQAGDPAYSPHLAGKNLSPGTWMPVFNLTASVANSSNPH